MDKETYHLWCVRKTIMQVSVLVRVASSNAWNDYYAYNKETFLLAHISLPCAESDRHMCLLTRVYAWYRNFWDSYGLAATVQN